MSRKKMAKKVGQFWAFVNIEKMSKMTKKSKGTRSHKNLLQVHENPLYRKNGKKVGQFWAFVNT